MRQGSNNGRRPRGRTNRKQHGGGGGGGGGDSRNRTFDSNGPDGRVRGNARQVYEKYLSLARDASSAGDRVAAEAYYQHAEHYFRILGDSTDPTPSGRRHDDRPQPPYSQDEGFYGDDEDEAPVNGANGARAQQGESRPPRDGERPQRREQNRDQRRDQGREGRDQERSAEPRQAAEAPAGDHQAPAAQPAPVEAAEGEAPARPRRGRPRKPRPEDDGQARQAETAPETESGPAAS